jgi:hypothetical protein
MGANASSVDDLLAGNVSGGSSSDEGMSGSARLQRQVTAVPDSPSGRAVGIDVEASMPEAVHEEDEESSGQRNPNPFDETTATLGRAIPIPPVDPFLAGSMSEAQTPMNDTFLSTLAPSVHQRLDLARQMDEVGRAAEPVQEEPAGEAEAAVAAEAEDRRTSDEWMEVDRQGSVVPEDRVERPERRDLEMMFT